MFSKAVVYCRYGAEQGKGILREAICNKLYNGLNLKPSDIFVSDGSKCDIGRLQVMLCASQCWWCILHVRISM